MNVDLSSSIQLEKENTHTHIQKTVLKPNENERHISFLSLPSSIVVFFLLFLFVIVVLFYFYKYLIKFFSLPFPQNV